MQTVPDWMFVALKKWGWKGSFDSWEAAQRQSSGYDAENILRQVSAAALKVKNGKAVFERDSVLFNKREYRWELLCALIWIAAQNNYGGGLNVVDFGGSLGSTYYQHKPFLDTLSSVLWNVVEQPNFVREGRRLFENETLKFYTSINECRQSTDSAIQVVLFSSVLQYLEQPYSILADIIKKSGIRHIIIDRTGFTLKNAEDRLTVQKVHPKIYEASYPCWFFNEDKFLRFFRENGYELLYEFKNLDVANVPSVYKGFVFELTSNA